MRVSAPSYFIWLSVMLLVFSCERTDISARQLHEKMLKKLPGTWQAEGEQLFEEWSLSGDSSYFATVYSLKNDEKIIRETIRLFIANFNPKHNFPKKIEYEFLNDHRLLATVGDGKGDMGKSFIIKYQRAIKEKPQNSL